MSGRVLYRVEYRDTRVAEAGSTLLMTSRGLPIREEPVHGEPITYTWDFIDPFGDPALTTRAPRLRRVVTDSGAGIEYLAYDGSTATRWRALGHAGTGGDASELLHRLLVLTPERRIETSSDERLGIASVVTRRDPASGIPTAWEEQLAGGSVVTERTEVGELDRRSVWPVLRLPQAVSERRDAMLGTLQAIPRDLVREEPNWSSP
jgi:hypothetical protein